MEWQARQVKQRVSRYCREVQHYASNTSPPALFDTTMVHRIQAGTEAENVAEQRVLESGGFVCEGIQPGLYPRAGIWRDSVCMAIAKRPHDLTTSRAR
jgi:hypothetical protein